VEKLNINSNRLVQEVIQFKNPMMFLI